MEGRLLKIKTMEKSYDEVMALPRPKHEKPLRPNIFFRTLMKLVSDPELKKVKFTCEQVGMEKIGKDEPCLFLMNHSSSIDLKIASHILYPRPFNIVCTSDGFVDKYWLMRQLGCIPTRKFVTDLTLIKDMIYAVRDLKSSVLMYPEASYTFDGTATALPDSLGKCIKTMKVPVVMIRTFGAFQRDPLYNNLQLRDVQVTAKEELLLTTDQIDEMSANEINDILKQAFTFDHHNKKGAECWFRARLDGEMEDFSLPDNAADTTHYSFFDIVSANCRLRSTSVSNCIVSQKFVLADSTSRMVPALSAVLPVDVWKRANCSVIRMPLSDNSWFYALTPKEGLSVRDIRGELSSNTLIDLIGGIKSITEINVSHGTTSVVVPVIDIVSQLDLTLPFGYFHIPLAGMERLDSKIKPRHVCQSVRFRLTEAKSDPTVAEESVRSPIANIGRVELSRPFLFFVYHEPTATIPVAGQFMGL